MKCNTLYLSGGALDVRSVGRWFEASCPYHPVVSLHCPSPSRYINGCGRHTTMNNTAVDWHPIHEEQQYCLWLRATETGNNSPPCEPSVVRVRLYLPNTYYSAEYSFLSI